MYDLPKRSPSTPPPQLQDWDRSVKGAGSWWEIVVQTVWQGGTDPAPLMKHLLCAELCQLGMEIQTKTSLANWHEVRGVEDGHVCDSVCQSETVLTSVGGYCARVCAFACVPTGGWLDTPFGELVMVLSYFQCFLCGWKQKGRWPCFPECNDSCPWCCNTVTISLLLLWSVWGSMWGHSLNWRRKGKQLHHS